MKYEVFEKIINKIKKSSDVESNIYKLGVDITQVVSEYDNIICMLLRAYYSEEGSEWIDWFLYEKFSPNEEILEAHDKDGNEICRNIKELWIIVEEIRCSSDFKEYELKPELSIDETMEIFKEIFKK